MDVTLDDVADWDAAFIAELIRETSEAEASRNPNPTPTTPAPAPISTYDRFAAAVSPVSCLPAASHPSPPRRFSPPPELSQRPPLPTAAASTRDDAGTDFSPPRNLGVGAKRDREARELEREVKKLKRELNRVSKQMNELKKECIELRKANVSFSKDVCSTGMDIDHSFHAPVNGALHAGGSSRTSTRRTDEMNGKDKDVHSLRDDLNLKQGHQTDLPEALEQRRHTIIDNGIGTSGVVSLEGTESSHAGNIMPGSLDTNGGIGDNEGNTNME